MCAVSVFSLKNVKESIETAVREAGSLPEDQQRAKIKQLRLRWHPDKNPVLGEFAAEVTKIINAAVEELRERQDVEGRNRAEDGDGKPQDGTQAAADGGAASSAPPAGAAAAAVGKDEEGQSGKQQSPGPRLLEAGEAYFRE